MAVEETKRSICWQLC